MRFVRILVAFAFALSGDIAPAARGAALVGAEALSTTQLPRGVRPLHYDVSIVPQAEDLRFDGRVAVTIEVAEATPRITLNAAGLTFVSVRLAPASSGSQAVAPTRIDLAPGSQTATFAFARPIAPGRYVLTLVYRGTIGTQAEGLFAIDYSSGAGPRRALFTQFENSHARHVIPSWDEPAYKATFTLDVVVPAAQMAVSNMPAASSEDLAGGRRRVRFAASPRMSTYLLFVAVGDFERIAAREGETEVGIVSRRGAAAQGGFALGESRAILREYNDYFDVAYPLPKLDNVASPGSSRFFSAMENWGAIYTFERVLLLDPEISTQADRERIFTVAAHEIAHQWFGNLVTMRWWDDVWLNEGFATWLEGRTTETLHPEWNGAITRVKRAARAMELDAFSTTHPIVQPVATVDQASQAFDTISYSKGAAVLDMLESYVGADAWRDGVRRYVKAHAYGNAVTDDLWRAIDAGGSRPVAAMAADFTRQGGVPLLRVESSDCRGATTTLALAQGEFSSDRGDKAPLRWRVPVLARVVGQAPAQAIVAGAGEQRLVVPGCGPVVVNAGRHGYYRTWYAPAPRAALRDAFVRLDAVDQLGAIDDAWALGLAGLVPLSDALELVARMPVEGDAAVWSSVAGRLQEMDEFYRGAPARQARWRAYAIGRLAPVLARVGWEGRAGESTAETVLREDVIGILGQLGDAATIAEARRRHAARASAPEGYPVALRQPILAVIARHADAPAWEAMREAARAEPSPIVKDRLYRFLGSAEDDTLARRALELAIGGEAGKTNAASILSEVAEEHPDLAFDFAVANRARLEGLVGVQSRNSFFPRLATGSIDAATADKLARFSRDQIAPGSRRAADTTIARVRFRARVAKERLDGVDAWLRAQRP